jgi:uncharacterized protein YutE (UPF0331/DUF86 family)
MDRDVTVQKLESLRRCIVRVQSKCPADAATLSEDFDLQDIVSLNLSRAVQMCVDMGAHLLSNTDVAAPETMGQTFERLAEAGIIDTDLAANLKKAVGFRNIATHNYEAINWQIVHNIVKLHIADFSAFAAAISATLTKP